MIEVLCHASRFGVVIGGKKVVLDAVPDSDKTRMITHVLFESASGYAIFEAKLTENIALKSVAMQDSIRDLGKFGKMVTLTSFTPFKSAAQALENANDVSEGTLYLKFYAASLTTVFRRPERLSQKPP